MRTLAAAAPEPVAERNEELLAPRHILEAVKKIGPQTAQDFYRALAGEADVTARAEAAIHLAECPEDDRLKNVAILRNLLGDADLSVRMPAAVSLLILGQSDVEAQILKWLRAGDRSIKGRVCYQLLRAPSAGSLRFARKAIDALVVDPSLDHQARGRARTLQARFSQ